MFLHYSGLYTVAVNTHQSIKWVSIQSMVGNCISYSCSSNICQKNPRMLSCFFILYPFLKMKVFVTGFVNICIFSKKQWSLGWAPRTAFVKYWEIALGMGYTLTNQLPKRVRREAWYGLNMEITFTDTPLQEHTHICWLDKWQKWSSDRFSTICQALLRKHTGPLTHCWFCSL